MVTKTIKIDDRDIVFAASGGTPRRYREEFGDDILQNMDKLTKMDTEVLEKLAYVMAKQANPDISSFEEWLDEFSMFGLVQAYPAIIKLWGLNGATTIRNKKK